MQSIYSLKAISSTSHVHLDNFQKSASLYKESSKNWPEIFARCLLSKVSNFTKGIYLVKFHNFVFFNKVPN